MLYYNPHKTEQQERIPMQDQTYDTKNRRAWQYFSLERRKKLEGLVDDFLLARGRHAKYARFPARRWAKTLECDESSVRRELARGKYRLGSGLPGDSYYYRYSAVLAEEKMSKASKRKGRPCLLERCSDPRFDEAVKKLIYLLSRKSALPKYMGFYSVYAAVEVVKRDFKEFAISPSTVKNWIKQGKLGNLTMKKVSIWTRTQKEPEKPTMPHNTAAKKHHHLCDRPKEVSGLKTPMHYEGDTVVSVRGDTTAVLSVLERMSNYQFFVKMGRNTQQCLHGALKRIVNAGAGIRTITWDNGMESGNVERIEKILKSAPSAYGKCSFYADAYASNQRARNEKNHTFFRRFMGHGKLARYSQGQILYITDFINRYPRKKFNGKSSEEVFEELKKQNPANPNNNETCN